MACVPSTRCVACHSRATASSTATAPAADTAAVVAIEAILMMSSQCAARPVIIVPTAACGRDRLYQVSHALQYTHGLVVLIDILVLLGWIAAFIDTSAHNPQTIRSLPASTG